MMWHETHRARMAARTLSKHRKKLEREPIIARTLAMAHQMNRPDLIARLEQARAK